MAYNPSTTGTVTGGSQEVNVIKEMSLLGTIRRIYQRITSTTTRIAGVSLNTARSLCAGTCSLRDYQLRKSNGVISVHDTCISCKGTKKSGTYSQIGDSNLYEVVLVNSSLAILKLNNEWDDSVSNLTETVS